MCRGARPRAPVAAVNVNLREGEGGVPYDAVNIRVNMWGGVGDAVPYK